MGQGHCLGSLEMEGFRPRRSCPHIDLTLFSLGGTSLSNYKQVLGPHHEVYEVERHPGESDIQFYVEGLAFPDTSFSGLISLSVSLVSTEVSARWGPGQGRGVVRGGALSGEGRGEQRAAWSPQSPQSHRALLSPRPSPRCRSSQTA